MSHRPGDRRRTSLLLIACLALPVAGCGSDGSTGAADPTSSEPTSPGVSTSGPAVDPASGRKISLAAFTARTLDGYDYDNSLAKEIIFSSSRDLGQDITFSDVTVYPGTRTPVAARLTIKNSSWRPKPRTVATVTMDGARWYHLTGPIGGGKHLEDYGTVRDSRLVRISFELTAPASKRRQIVDSVLATVHLK